MPMNRAAGTPLPHTSPTPTATRPSARGTRSKKSPPTSRAGVIAAQTSRLDSVGELLHPGQKRALDDRRARHFVVTLTAQNDLLGHAPEGLPEIGEVGNRIAQFLEQRGIEFVALEPAQRVRVEADRAIELAHAIAHPADDVDEQGRRRVSDFDQRGAAKAKSRDGRAGARGGAARQLRERAHFSNQRRGPEELKREWRPSAVGADCHLPLQDQHRAIAGFALHHEGGVGIECLEFGCFDQDRKVVVGQLSECARRPNGGAQLRGIFHVIMGRSNHRDDRCVRRRILARDGSCHQSGGSSCAGKISA